MAGSLRDLAVIFDCDGVLLDSMGMWHNLDDRLAARAGVTLSKQDRDYMTSASIAECCGYLHSHCGIGASAQDVDDMIQDEMYRYYASEVEPKAGVMDFVKALDEVGIPMAVASSTPHRLLVTGLERTGFMPYMKRVVSVDDVSSSKREPKVYDHAREALGTSRERTWGVEDSLYAIDTLNNAGYRTLAVYDNNISGDKDRLGQQADLFVVSFRELSMKRFLEIAESMK